jgi:ATP phosphoribosyltransferase
LSTDIIHFALPKGRMQDGVIGLLQAAGIPVTLDARGYRPRVGLPGWETKLLKPQNVVEMLDVGSRDVGFAGADWVAEKGARLVEVLDTGMDPVQIVAAVPEDLAWPPGRPVIVASEYAALARAWIAEEGVDARLVHTYGATEVFPPEDADCIVDNSATGSTLVANRLRVVATLMRSSTRMYASERAWTDPSRRARIEDLAMLVGAVLEARKRVMLELNVSADKLEAVVARLPCMRVPTISALMGNEGFAVKAAVPRAELPTLLPALKAAGGTDLVVTPCAQILP